MENTDTQEPATEPQERIKRTSKNRSLEDEISSGLLLLVDHLSWYTKKYYNCEPFGPYDEDFLILANLIKLNKHFIDYLLAVEKCALKDRKQNYEKILMEDIIRESGEVLEQPATIEQEREFPDICQDIRFGDERLQIIHRMHMFAESNPKFKTSYLESVEAQLEKRGYISPAQYNQLAKTYYAFKMDEHLDE